MFRFIMLSLLSVSIAFSNFNIASSSTSFSTSYIYPIYPLYPINNSYQTYYTDYIGYDNIYKYKLFEIKNDRLGIIDAIKSSFRSLYYPFERKIPLYANIFTNRS